MKWRPVVAVAVAILAWWLATIVNPVVVAGVAAVSATVAARRRLRWRQLRRHLTPTVDVLRRSFGAGVSVKVTPAFAALIPRPARRLPTPQLRIGDRIWRRLPAIRLPARPPRLAVTFATGYLSKASREHANAVITAKLGIDGLTQAWDMRGRTVTGTWTPRARPPARVGADAVSAGMPARDSAFFVGLGAGNRPVTVDLSDSPHIALSGGSGSGKSTLVAVIAAQVLLRGGRVVVCDIKTNSHAWAAGMSTVVYAATVERIHHVLTVAATIAARRNARGSARYPILVVVEEANSTVSRLRAHWESTRGKGDPKASPAIAALAELVHQGRSARVHVLVAAQQLSARSVGGAEVRESFGARMLARASAGTWRMLAGPGVPMPPRTRVPGRWHLAVDDQVQEVQVPLVRPTDVRRILRVPGVPGLPTTAVRRDVPGDMAPTGDKAAPLSISQAIDAGVIPWSREATKKRLRRSDRPPAPVDRRGQTFVYERRDLVEWVARETA